MPRHLTNVHGNLDHLRLSLNKKIINRRTVITRHKNILAALGGIELNEAIQRTRDSLKQQWQPSQLVVSTAANEPLTLTLEERHAIGKVVREILETRLSVLENETE